MTLTPEQLRCIPLLYGLTEEQLAQLGTAADKVTLDKGEELFRVDQPAEAFFLLSKGEVTIYEGEKERYRLKPPASIGELGALAGLDRNTTAVATRKAEVWRFCREPLLEFFASHRALALPFYQNLVLLIADKVRRDQTRLQDMRRNIIRTQKAMKQMRDYLLESEDTVVSETLHNTLEELIKNNRRVNYRVVPPDILAAHVRLSDGVTCEVAEISRTHLSYEAPEGPLPALNASWSGVLNLGGPEIPISGRVLRTLDRRVDVQLDLLIDSYGAILDGYLARIQMLDFMV